MTDLTNNFYKMEIWKDIKDYEGLYQVSNLGNVKSLNYLGWGKKKLLKPGLDGNGYYHVCLSKKSKVKRFKIHRLVYETFIGEFVSGLVIDHINGIPTENNVENLQQITNRENTTKGLDKTNKHSKYIGVTLHKHSNKWVAGIMIRGEKKHLGYFNTELEASVAYQAELSKINF